MRVTIRNPFALVLMPFQNAFDPVYDAIREACEEGGINCQRVDEQTHMQNIMQQIYDQISAADVIIADTTGGNANVFYETGYARALKKPIVHITQSQQDIPFDLTQYQHFVYSLGSSTDVAKFKTGIRKYLRHCLEPRGDSVYATAELPFYFFNERNSKCVDVLHGSPENGVHIVSHQFHGEANQIWTLYPIEEDVFRVVSLATGKCLSVADNADAADAFMVQWDYSNADTQHWKLDKVTERSYRLLNQNSQKCLAIWNRSDEDGANLVQRPWRLNDPDQRWLLLVSTTLGEKRR